MKQVDLLDLPEYRRKTDTVSKALKTQLSVHLETLRPLFAPERVLGLLAGGRTEVPRADRVLADLQEQFQAFAAPPYSMTGGLEPERLLRVGTAPELLPWDRIELVNGQKVTFSSPCKWLLAYRGSPSLAQVRQALGEPGFAPPESLRTFILNALVLAQVVSRFPGIGTLFRDLGCNLVSEKLDEFPGLPLTTLTVGLRAFRPSGQVITAACSSEGSTTFTELIDESSLQAWRTPLQEKVAALSASPS